jgi:hypothetical protein
MILQRFSGHIMRAPGGGYERSADTRMRTTPQNAAPISD